MKKWCFLRWALLVSLVAVSCLIAGLLGVLGSINEMDATKLSFLILAIFVTMTVYCGILTWKLELLVEDDLPDSRALLELENLAEHGWFAGNLCEKFGLTGTVCGFIMMLVGGFKDFQGTDPQAIQQLLGQLSSGMSTAFITTLVGIVCSIFLSIQYHNLSNAIERMRL